MEKTCMLGLTDGETNTTYNVIVSEGDFERAQTSEYNLLLACKLYAVARVPVPVIKIRARKSF